MGATLLRFGIVGIRLRIQYQLEKETFELAQDVIEDLCNGTLQTCTDSALQYAIRNRELIANYAKLTQYIDH